MGIDVMDIRNRDLVMNTNSESVSLVDGIRSRIQGIKEAIQSQNIPLVENRMYEFEDYLQEKRFEKTFYENPELRNLKSEAILFLDKVYEALS